MTALLKPVIKVAVLNTVLFVSSSVLAADYEALLEWSQLKVVGFPVDGGVIAVHANAGDRVKKGDTLIELNPEPNEIRIRELKAELAARKPAVTDTKREYEHAQSLYEQTVLSDVALQKAKLNYDKASAELQAAQARLELAQWRLRQKTARAPWDAVVVSRDIEEGMMLIAEQRTRAWMVLAKADVIGARADIPASAAAGLKTGQKVKIKVATQTYDASVIELKHLKDRKATSYSVLVEFAVPADKALIAGMPATISLP